MSGREEEGQAHGRRRMREGSLLSGRAYGRVIGQYYAGLGFAQLLGGLGIDALGDDGVDLVGIEHAGQGPLAEFARVDQQERLGGPLGDQAFGVAIEGGVFVGALAGDKAGANR